MDKLTTKQEITLYLSEKLSTIFTESVAVLGGYARDTYFGRSPKDADIFVHMGESGMYQGDRVLTALSLTSVLPDFLVTHMVAYGDGGGLDDFCERHHGVLKLTFKELNFSVDILFTREDNPMSSLAAFDCNLNQALMDKEGEVYWLYGNPPATLRFRDTKLRPERIKKMQDYARSYTQVFVEGDEWNSEVNRVSVDQNSVEEVLNLAISYITRLGFTPSVEALSEVYIKHPDNWDIAFVHVDATPNSPCKIQANWLPKKPEAFFAEHPEALQTVVCGVVA